MIKDRKGVLILIGVTSGVTLFMGMFQILAEPLILSFADARTLGTTETICASGMLVSGIILGVKGLKSHYIRTLGISLAMAGLFMTGFGLFEKTIPICVFGFLFFAALPVANNCLDYLIRTNIPDDVQGRAWGLIGFISQTGYVVAYGISGAAADMLGRTGGRGVGRGAGLLVMTAGVCLCVTAITIMFPNSIRKLETVNK